MKRSIRGLLLLLAVSLLLSALPVQAAQTDYLSEEEWRVLLLTNRERLKEGLVPFTATSFLQAGCDTRAREIEELFSHTRPDGTDCFTVFDEVDTPIVTTAGENIAAGQRDADEVVEAWMNSPGHRANILNADFAHMGAGYHSGGAPYYRHWVQLFFTGYGCEYTKMELKLPENSQIEAGGSVDDMGILLVLTCKTCGDCYLPLMEEFCKDYDPEQEGQQTVTVSCFGMTEKFTVGSGEGNGTQEPDDPDSDCCDGGTDCPSGSFRDVDPSQWYHEGVDYALNNSLMNGTGDGKFEPDSPMTRAMLVTVLWRYAGAPEEGLSDFTDVKEDAWYAKAVAWAAKNGVVTGVGNGRFDPEGKITREQMAAILYRYSNSLGLDAAGREPLGYFPDGGMVSTYAADALSWAVAEGLITGSRVGSKTYLDPQGKATRAQVATILMRYIEGVIQ